MPKARRHWCTVSGEAKARASMRFCASEWSCTPPAAFAVPAAVSASVSAPSVDPTTRARSDLSMDSLLGALTSRDERPCGRHPQSPRRYGNRARSQREDDLPLVLRSKEGGRGTAHRSAGGRFARALRGIRLGAGPRWGRPRPEFERERVVSLPVSRAARAAACLSAAASVVLSTAAAAGAVPHRAVCALPASGHARCLSEVVTLPSGLLPPLTAPS